MVSDAVERSTLAFFKFHAVFDYFDQLTNHVDVAFDDFNKGLGFAFRRLLFFCKTNWGLRDDLSEVVGQLVTNHEHETPAFV